MSTPYVTIGGKEVDLSPGAASLHRPVANVSAAPAQPAGRTPHGRPRRATKLVGLLAALGLLIVFVVWLSQQRHR